MLVMSVALFRLKYRVDPVSKSPHQDLKLLEGELAFEHKTRPLRATFGRRGQPHYFADYFAASIFKPGLVLRLAIGGVHDLINPRDRGKVSRQGRGSRHARTARAGSEGGASRFRDFDAHELDRCASDAASARGCETVADQARDYLPREAVREQARFGASIGRVGEQAERALASDLWHALSRALGL